MNKKIALALIAIIAISSLALAASVNAQAATSTATPAPSGTNGLLQRSYIRINGIVKDYGGATANGALQTQARTALFATSNTNQLAMSTAIWTTDPRPIASIKSKASFTYTFYVARLKNASVSSFSATTSDSNYILSGTWTVYTTTSNVQITTNTNGDVTGIHRTSDTSVQSADGTLTVKTNWSTFTLTFPGSNGIKDLSGTVFRTVTRQVQFNPFKVTDDTTTTAVTRADVAAVVKSYGAIPGWGNFDVRMDFCNHNKIDIADLSTVACNL